jgi:hypothetical protein
LEGPSLPQANSEAHSWDEQRFERLLRMAAILQGTLPKSRQPFEPLEDVPVRAKIESCAYDLYLRRGATHGRALDDWLSAERQVLAKYGENNPKLRLVLAFGLMKGF